MTAMPELLQELLRLEYDHDAGRGMDFEQGLRDLCR
jgi:hypothetical protein